MYNIEYTGSFKRDYKLALKRGYKEPLIQNIIILLADGTQLPAKNRLHKLTGDYKDCWECHIQPDWLLIWQININTNTLILIRTGTHSDLF
jgi:mRNA interferase YafQ